MELADFDRDGREDLVISRTDDTPYLLMNEGGVLTNRTAAFLPSATAAANSNYSEAVDVDGDGWVDIVFGRINNRTPRLYRNLGETNGNWQGFDSGSDIAGANNILVVESGDVNGDGAPDLFIIQVERAQNRLLINDGEGNFSQQSSLLGSLQGKTRGHAAQLEDVDNDGDTDIIYIESDLTLEIYYNNGSGNFGAIQPHVFQNPDNFAYIFGAADFNGDGFFDYRQYSNPGPLAEMSTGALDNQGRPRYQIRQEPNMLRGNRKHGFVHIRDIDGDGDPDYVLSSILRNFGGLFNSFEGMRTEWVINTGLFSGNFVTFVGDEWGNEESWDMKILDVNGDGNMDKFVAHSTRMAVYINDAPAQTVTLSDTPDAPAMQAGSPGVISVTLENGTASEYAWDFGDGTTATTTSLTTTHNYANPGRYLITVVASSPLGSDQITFRQRVHEPLSVTPPVSSMDTVYEVRDDNDRIYIVNPDQDTVTVVDAITASVLAEIPVGDEPRSLALDNPGILCVVNKGDATVTRVNTNTLQAVATFNGLPRGSRPHGLVFDADKQFAYIALEQTGQVVKVDFPSQTIVATADVGPTPREIGLSDDGAQLYVPRFITLPVAGESTRTPAEGGGEMLVLNTSDMTLSGTIDLPYNNPGQNVDTNVNARGIPNYLRSPALSPAGNAAVIPMKLDNIYRGSMRDGQAREHDMLVRGALARIDLASQSENLEARVQFDNNSQPTAAAFGPNGNYLYVVHEASRTYEVFDFYANEIIFSGTVGFAPTGVAVSADGTRVYIHNWLDRSLSIIDSSGLMDGTSDNADVIDTVALVSSEALNALALTGKRLFHDSGDLRLSAQKYISCASCHDEGSHDGRTWDFSDAGEGLRNTIDLRGRAGIGHGNVHWSANFDEFHDFENDIREIFDGSGLMSDADFEASRAPLDASTPKAGRSSALDALAAFASTLTSVQLSPNRNADGSLTASAVAGRQVFSDAGCAACHSDATFSDSPSEATHNIGTVDGDTGGRLGMPLKNGGLDTPTLLGMWDGAPYLHDGSAATLQQATAAHTQGINIDIDTLTAADLDNLAAYLGQIDASEPAPAPVDLNPVDPMDPVDPVDPVTPIPTISNAANISVDGSVQDWSAVAAAASDPDDVSGLNNTLDYASAWFAHDANNWYVRFDSHAPDPVVVTWGYTVSIDADTARNTGFRGFGDELPIGIDYMVQGGTLHRYTGAGTDWSWASTGTVPVAISGQQAELSIARNALGGSETVHAFFFADNSAVGGDALDYFPDAASDPAAPLEARVFAYNFGGVVIPPVLPQQPTVFNPVTSLSLDGDLSDWADLRSLGADPDDVANIGEQIDWRQGWLAHSDTQLYVAWRNDADATLSWGNGVMLDTDQNRNTGFRGFSNELPTGVDYLIEADTLHRYTGSGNDWSWNSPASVAPVIVGGNVELSLPLSLLGDPPFIDVFFVGNNTAIGGTAVDFFPDAAVNIDAPRASRYFTYSTSGDTPPPAPSIAIDGDLSDWPDTAQLGVDDADDVDGLNTIDWQRSYVTDDGSNLLIAYSTYDAFELTWGYGILIDTDNDINTGFRGFGRELPIGAEFILEGAALNRYTGATQVDWQWSSQGQMQLAAGLRGAEVSIPLTALGSPAAVQMLWRGDNSAVNGDALDYHPDGASLSYNISGNQPQLDQPVQQRQVQNRPTQPLGAPELGAAIASDGTSGGAGGTGSGSIWALLALGFFGLRRFCVPGSGRMQVRRLIWLGMATGLLAACDSDTMRDTSTQPSAPQNNPSLFNNVVTNPARNVSFGQRLEVELSGAQQVPLVASSASGHATLVLNTLTGELAGSVSTTVANATGAGIHRGAQGVVGEQLIALIQADPAVAEFSVATGTQLDSAAVRRFIAGELYIQITSMAYPAGEIRAQLTPDDVIVTAGSTLEQLQAKVFSPTCARCHSGGGQTLPSSMDFTNAGATYASLVNTDSTKEPGKVRVMPGSANDSYLINKIEGTHAVGSRMPFRGSALPPDILLSIRNWVDQGATP